MYTSEISHFSMEKSAHILGMGYESVVKVPVDKNKKMDNDSLEILKEIDINEMIKIRKENTQIIEEKLKNNKNIKCLYY